MSVTHHSPVLLATQDNVCWIPAEGTSEPAALHAMETRGRFDEQDTSQAQAQALMARQLLNITDAMDTMAVTDDLDPGRVQSMARLESDGEYERASERLIRELISVELSIYDLESTEPSAKFVPGLEVVLTALRPGRKELACLFNIPGDQKPGNWSEVVVRELDGMIRLLDNFRPRLASVELTTTKGLFRGLISTPLQPERSLAEARSDVDAALLTLRQLWVSTQPVAALHEVPAAETSGLGRGAWIYNININIINTAEFADITIHAVASLGLFYPLFHSLLSSVLRPTHLSRLQIDDDVTARRG
ncbi:hypothetical protein F5Y14DRAFT_455665 [Nemania sp. NC0429]|nr:hypothetical protein F5Y14DRAFT_455665 [Nemania sp. NC0429]